MKAYPHEAVNRIRGFFAQYKELHERQYLRNRPWLEESLHWSRNGQLHGHIAPSPARRCRSVTSEGWCPGCAPAPRLFDSDPG